MSGAHLTLMEIRACARGEDESLIEVAVEHCSECEECAGNLAAALAIMEHGRGARRWKSPTWGQAAAACLILVAVGFAVAAAIRTWSPAQPPSFVEQTPSLEARVPSLEEQSPSLEGQVPSLEGQVASLEGQVASLEGQVASLEAQVAALATTETLPRLVVRFQLGIASPAGFDDTIARLQRAGFAVADEQYTEAIAELEQLHDRNPDSDFIAAYLGIALYLSGDDSARTRALLRLGAASNSTSIAYFTKWYLANHLLRVNEVAEARDVLSEIKDRSDLPGQLSRELLQALDNLSR